MASNFGFSVPGSATIEGVQVEIIRMSSTSPNVKDSIAQIITGGNAGNNYADTSAWTPSLSTVLYGDSTDVWGLPLIADSVNSIHFGFRLMIRNASPIVTFAPSSVDNIRMTVYYSLSTGTFSQTRTANDFTIYPNPAKEELRIRNAELKIEKIEIYNAHGERIFSQPVTTNLDQLTISVADFSPGIYFAIIDTGAEKIKKKFILSGD
jgi:hypothetical protein